MRRVTLSLLLAVFAAAPAAAHVVKRAAEDTERHRSIFTQQPIALPVQQQADAPPMTATPRAKCGPGANPEPSIQGRVPKDEVDSGRAEKGYWCNLERIGQIGQTG